MNTNALGRRPPTSLNGLSVRLFSVRVPVGRWQGNKLKHRYPTIRSECAGSSECANFKSLTLSPCAQRLAGRSALLSAPRPSLIVQDRRLNILMRTQAMRVATLLSCKAAPRTAFPPARVRTDGGRWRAHARKYEGPPCFFGAPVYESGGQEFESLRARQYNQ